MLIGFLATEIRFANFNGSLEIEASGFVCLTQTVQQVPGALLRDIQFTVEPHTGYAFQIGNNQVRGNRLSPIIQL